MKQRTILLMLSAITFAGCGLTDSGSHRITGRYIVLWIDQPGNQTIAKEDSNSSGSTIIVPEYVFAVGHNDRYIIAKQHPTSGFEGGYKTHADTTNYYIVNIQKNNKPLGPLKKQEFDSLRIKLKIQNIPFDKIYPDSAN